MEIAYERVTVGAETSEQVNPLNIIYFPCQYLCELVRNAGFEGINYPSKIFQYRQEEYSDIRAIMPIDSSSAFTACPLVRRYAHLSPSHLKSVVERVSTFGKASAEKVEELKSGSKMSQSEATVSIETVIKPRWTDQAPEWLGVST